MTDFENECAVYRDDPTSHLHRHERFIAAVNATPWLKEHRDFVEQHVLGMGERSFHWLWKLLVEEMPTDFRFLEIGVLMGQVVSLVPWIARNTGKTCFAMGITPLSSFAGPNTPPHWDNDYWAKIRFLHDHFEQPVYNGWKEWGYAPDYAPRGGCASIAKGDSTEEHSVRCAQTASPFDIVYIDGCHEYDYVVQDIRNYAPLVRKGGFLVIDDASCRLKMWNGSFPGIESVCDAIADELDPDDRFEHRLAVMHNRVWQRVG